MVENLFLKNNPLQDLLSSLSALISTNESTRTLTSHVIYNPAYTYKFQLKTTHNTKPNCVNTPSTFIPEYMHATKADYNCDFHF